MKQVSEMPTSGQFVAVWCANGSIWCATYFIENNSCCEYLPSEGTYSDFYEIDNVISDMNRNNAQYFIAD